MDTEICLMCVIFNLRDHINPEVTKLMILQTNAFPLVLATGSSSRTCPYMEESQKAEQKLFESRRIRMPPYFLEHCMPASAIAINKSDAIHWISNVTLLNLSLEAAAHTLLWPTVENPNRKEHGQLILCPNTIFLSPEDHLKVYVDDRVDR